MMAGTAAPSAGGTGKGAAAESPPEQKTKRSVCPLLERVENLAGTSSVSAKGQPQIPIINRLLELV
jgi:hypothetical protein